MKVDMLMPQMGESIAEATIIKWLKNPGENVKKDEVILEISTDKVDSEIPAPASGTLSQTFFKAGDVVPVKERIAVIDTAGGAAVAASPSPPPTPEPRREAPPAAAVQAEVVKEAPTPREEPRRPAPAMQHGSNGNGHAHVEHDDSDRFYSPLVKSLAEKHGIALSELNSVQGSGHSGRVTKQDLLHYIDNRGDSARPTATEQPRYESRQEAPAEFRESPPSSARQGEGSHAIQTRPSAPPMNFNTDDVRVEPMDRMRQAIANHMVMSKQTSPHVYSVQEIDVTNIAKWREQQKRTFTEREGFNLSFTPFFLEAAVRALLEFPYVNASIQGNTILVKKHINLGCAVALGTSGLIVPVIKRAEEKNLVGIARSLNDLAGRAREKALMPDDVSGGTFTVTNPGTFGTVIGYPIINQPQLAILSVGAIQKRPVVINDAIAIRQMVFLTLSYDHRLIDGSMGGSFLAFVRQYLEGWDMKRSLY